MLIQSPQGWSQHLRFGGLNWIIISDFSPTRLPGSFVSSSCMQLFKSHSVAKDAVTQAEQAWEAALPEYWSHGGFLCWMVPSCTSWPCQTLVNRLASAQISHSGMLFCKTGLNQPPKTINSCLPSSLHHLFFSHKQKSWNDFLKCS